MFADVPRVLRGAFSKSARNCTVAVVRAGDGASKNDDHAGQNEVVPASLYFFARVWENTESISEVCADTSSWKEEFVS